MSPGPPGCYPLAARSRIRCEGWISVECGINYSRDPLSVRARGVRVELVLDAGLDVGFQIEFLIYNCTGALRGLNEGYAPLA